jgi:hypothetical protein
MRQEHRKTPFQYTPFVWLTLIHKKHLVKRQFHSNSKKIAFFEPCRWWSKISQTCFGFLKFDHFMLILQIRMSLKTLQFLPQYNLVSFKLQKLLTSTFRAVSCDRLLHRPPLLCQLFNASTRKVRITTVLQKLIYHFDPVPI